MSVSKDVARAGTDEELYEEKNATWKKTCIIISTCIGCGEVVLNFYELIPPLI